MRKNDIIFLFIFVFYPLFGIAQSYELMAQVSDYGLNGKVKSFYTKIEHIRSDGWAIWNPFTMEDSVAFDENGFKIKEKEGNFFHKLDSLGYRIEMYQCYVWAETYDTIRFVYIYNEKKQIVQTNIYENNPHSSHERWVLNKIWRYRYDLRGFLVERSDYYVQSNLSEVFNHTLYYEYDAKGNMIASNTIHEGKAGIFEFQYDSSNNVIKQEHFIDFKSDNEVYTFTYEIDAHGNWITQTESLNGTVQTLITRTIVYY